MLRATALALLTGCLLAAPRPVVLNAIYGLDQQLIPTFGVYYGLQSLQMIRVEFDFGMEQIVMAEAADYASEGVECAAEFGCEVSDRTEYVTDSRVRKMFLTSLAQMPLKLPQTTDAEGDHTFNLWFNMYRGGKLRVRNVIGLSPSSPFWVYIAIRYGKPSFSLVIHTDFKMRTAAEIYENPDAIFTKLIFFDKGETSTTGFREQVTDALAFSSVAIGYGAVTPVCRQPSFSLNQPFLFRICMEDYQALVKELQQQICPEPSHCETANDLYGNLSGKSKLVFAFSPPEDYPSKSSFKVEVSVSDLFYVTQQQKIAYNFEPLVQGGGFKPNQIELGLLFLNRVRLEVSYGSTGKVFLAITAKEFPAQARVYWAYMVGSAALSLVIVAVIALCLTGPKPTSSSSYSPSLNY